MWSFDEWLNYIARIKVHFAFDSCKIRGENESHEKRIYFDNWLASKNSVFLFSSSRSRRCALVALYRFDRISEPLNCEFPVLNAEFFSFSILKIRIRVFDFLSRCACSARKITMMTSSHFFLVRHFFFLISFPQRQFTFGNNSKLHWMMRLMTDEVQFYVEQRFLLPSFVVFSARSSANFIVLFCWNLFFLVRFIVAIRRFNLFWI